MCGIVGYWGQAAERGLVEAMAERIAHRGPDAHGSWVDPERGIALGHRRLSILDLSPAGAQPMRSPCGDYVVSYNGEIYNHLDLRAELERIGRAPDWRGHSDTETLTAALSAWGVRGALERLNGMFALAVWRRSTSTLTLARDRMGEKPLYYGRCGGTFFFTSS
jgi:asparagine synthase (glutamine-hydrolysing)